MSFKLSTGNNAYPSASASISSNGTTSATIKVTASCYLDSGWVYSTGVVAKIYINGSKVATTTILGNENNYYASDGTKSVSATKSITKTTSSQSIPWYVEFWQYTDGVEQSKKQTISGSISVSAKTSYTISYNANGGSGAPSNQTKWYGTNLTLSSTKPTRTGYSFNKWNTNSGGTGTSYNSGATYTANAAATLYAQWTANTYTVSYNANGGTGAPGNQTKTYGVDLTLSSTKPTRTNYNFLGWGMSASAITVSYAAGATYSANSAITLYAVWELAYWKPKVADLRVERCTSDGTADNFGTYASVNFNWELCQLLGTNNISSIEIAIDDGTPTTVSASGTSGTVSEIVGANALSIDTSYSIKITVTDSESESTSYTRTIPSSSFPIDFLAGGTGVNFGGPAEETGFRCSWAAEFDGKLTANAGAHVTGGFTEDIPIHVSGDCNSLTTTGKYYIGTSGTNKPGSGLNGWLECKKYSTDYCHQVYTTHQGHTYTRLMSAGTWGSWRFIHGTSGSQYTNKVLWSGAYYMMASQSVTLSEAISAQPHGVVLVWCYYNSSVSAARPLQGVTMFFVPKIYVAENSGFEMSFAKIDQGNNAMCKSLYISDTTITGHAKGYVDGTYSGVTVKNTLWVLCRVIGV